MTEVFNFEHEGVNGVLIDGKTYVDAVELASRLATDAAQQMASAVARTLLIAPQNEDDVADALDRIEDALVARGAMEEVQFIHRLAHHFADVAERLSQGLPAHRDLDESETEDQSIDTLVEGFALALDGLTADDFANLGEDEDGEKD